MISSLFKEAKFPLFKFGYLSDVSLTWLARPSDVLNVLLLDWRMSLANTKTRPLTFTAISVLGVEIFQLLVVSI